MKFHIRWDCVLCVLARVEDCVSLWASKRLRGSPKKFDALDTVCDIGPHGAVGSHYPQCCCCCCCCCCCFHRNYQRRCYLSSLQLLLLPSRVVIARLSLAVANIGSHFLKMWIYFKNSFSKSYGAIKYGGHMLVRSLNCLLRTALFARSLHSRAQRKEIYVYELTASFQYNFAPLCIVIMVSGIIGIVVKWSLSSEE